VRRGPPAQHGTRDTFTLTLGRREPTASHNSANGTRKQVSIGMKMKTCRTPSQVLLACALGAGVAASASGSTDAAPRTPVLVAYSSSDESVIAANWMAFFNPGTPVAKWIALLQDGQQFATVIKSQASSGLAAQASAKVTKVTLISPTQAKVVCTIYEGGRPALANQTGVAVKQDGTWKVGIASFCGLLALENGGKTAAVPPACKAAG
jgi:hypothetical protein